jgi:hypothetical protein
VQVETLNEAPVYLRIIDFSGREVYRGEFQAQQVNQGLRVEPIEKMDDGLYILLVNQNDKVTQHRISIKN